MSGASPLMPAVRALAPRRPGGADPQHPARRSLRQHPGGGLPQKSRKGYGRWLSFLESRGRLDPNEPALARVTRPRLRAYFHTLLKSGNASMTVIERFLELELALRIMAPGEDVAWVHRPDNATVYSLLCKSQRFLVVPHSDVLFDWGLEMMDAAAACRQRARTSPSIGTGC